MYFFPINTKTQHFSTTFHIKIKIWKDFLFIYLSPYSQPSTPSFTVLILFFFSFVHSLSHFLYWSLVICVISNLLISNCCNFCGYNLCIKRIRELEEKLLDNVIPTFFLLRGTFLWKPHWKIKKVFFCVNIFFFFIR